jgi:hypothetical protein
VHPVLPSPAIGRIARSLALLSIDEKPASRYRTSADEVFSTPFAAWPP